MGSAELRDIDTDSMLDAVGPACYMRGVEYALHRAVREVWWDESACLLHGQVSGTARQPYRTTVHLAPAGGRRLVFETSECSCPVGVGCKHAVAIVLTATQSISPFDRAPLPEVHDVPAKDTGTGGWERSLESLLAPGPSPGEDGQSGVPLAVELSLSRGTVAPVAAGTGQLKLLAKLVRSGKNGWVAGNVSWARLEALHLHGEYPTEQLRILQEMRAVYQARAKRIGYYSYGYTADRAMDLVAFESRQLWPLLDEAVSRGIRLVYPHKLGDVPHYQDAEFCFDVSEGDPDGPLVIRPSLRVGGKVSPATLLSFMGTEGHGAVYTAAQDHVGGDLSRSRFQLARFTKPVPPQMQRMALAGQRLEVPASNRDAFRDNYYLRLRNVATVVSSDGSFAPPEVSGPTLVLSAHYRGDHEAEARWEWAYQVGETEMRAPVGADPTDAYRDIDAERSLVAGLDLPLERFGLGLAVRETAGPARAVGPVRLRGLDTMRFTTEALPALEGLPSVRVEVSGEPAGYREVGDSLSVGVSTHEVAGETDWFDLGITITAEGREVPFVDVFKALARGEQYLLLPDGAYFSLDKPGLRALAALIEEARALSETVSEDLRISRFQAGLWDELAALGFVDHQAAAWQRQVQGLLDAAGGLRREAPASLTARLRPYQLDGFGWLSFLWQHRLGGILADDMGLGKTLQSLALISHARAAEPDAAPFLIVAPTSVVGNWAAEAERFAPGLRVVVVTESAARRKEPLSEVCAGADAVVTSYTLLRIGFAEYDELGWSGLLMDEAQYAKNHQSKTYGCLRKLGAPFKVAITGTPMENNLMELWSLLSITAPGLFPHPGRFRDYYAKPIETEADRDLLDQLRRRVRPLVMRRTKEQVAPELPPKQEQVLEVDLHPRHRKVYQTHLQRERQKVLGLLDDLDTHRFAIFRSLTLLRQLSLHAGLIDDNHADLPSAKIDALLDDLHDVTGSGHRALVFSQFTGFLAKVRQRLDAEGIPYCYLDGKTRDRPTVLRAFKDGTAPVFLISLKAGGFGLNLTEADYCFLLDPWWNPATETQAVDRTHRIGQTRNVMVYRLIAKDTIEEKVMALKARKAALFTSVLDEGAFFSSALDADDIRGLLT